MDARLRQRIPAPLWPLLIPEPDRYYRWRIQLDCGCITEVLTQGDTVLPAERRWPDHGQAAKLPAGQILCQHDDSPPAPYREITEWGQRREVSFPADPVDPPDSTDQQTWVKLRRDEPYTSAFWTVTLSCGHVTEVVAGLDWKPEQGPHRVNAARQQEMIAEFAEFWASEPDGQAEREREHTKRMLAQGWPMPQTERLCYTCPHARFIIAYQRAGWLVPRTPEPKQPKLPSRSRLEQRLRQAETEADRLREQLARLDPPMHHDREALHE